MTDITYNGLPVYQNSARDDRYIIYNGELIIFYYSIMNIHINLANSWFLTHEISNSGLRELICSAKEKGQIADGLDWQYNRYPNCQTVRSEVRIFFQRISVWLMFHCLQWTRKTFERISRRGYVSGWGGSQLCLSIWRRSWCTQRVQETYKMGEWGDRGHWLQGNYMLFRTCT